MKKQTENKYYLCLHGHFYQPPRENAWTGEIDTEPSAAPFHNWNERIYQECYKPNSCAVIVDDRGNVKKRINNYEYLNFDFGPTLFNWLKKHHPKTYDKIIEADKESAALHRGHGNAIAMVYNHIIMPLANERDKITQIKWGVRDFEHHFQRKPESIWLAETACNDATVEALINENIKYIILDPSQAEAYRESPEGEWHDVSKGNINTAVPYRRFSEKYAEKYIDIFFYNGALAKAVAFEDMLFDSHRLMERIKGAATGKGGLISIATDGETFGHHKAYSERTIAYLFDELAEEQGFALVNYGEFLEKTPPQSEVKIKNGRDGLGTAWSCMHGVGRWKEDCGCSTGGEPGWNQEWRKPLREALNKLNEKLADIFEAVGSEYLKDVWEARNDYIYLILNPEPESYEKFFYFNAKRYLTEEESAKCIRLLEMQKYGMYMFTSCAWFFSEVSGIETVQILEYAARAIEIAEELTGEDIKADFMEKLEEAKSNKPEIGDAKKIFMQIQDIAPGNVEKEFETNYMDKG